MIVNVLPQDFNFFMVCVSDSSVGNALDELIVGCDEQLKQICLLSRSRKLTLSRPQNHTRRIPIGFHIGNNTRLVTSN